MILHLQTVEPRKGPVWIRHGFKVFRRRPLAMTALYGVFVMAWLLLASLPDALAWLAPALAPLASLGFMLATHAVLQGQVPNASVYAAPLRLTHERRNAQLLLCLIYGLLFSAGLLLAQSVGGDALEHLRAVYVQEPRDEQAVMMAMSDPRLFWRSVISLGTAALLSVPFWHAPALVHWAGQGVGQALFSSTLALWRNRWAFARYALAFVGFGLAFFVLLTLVAGLLGEAIAGVLAVLAFCWLQIVFNASLYFSFVDCFMFSPEDIKI